MVNSLSELLRKYLTRLNNEDDMTEDITILSYIGNVRKNHTYYTYLEILINYVIHCNRQLMYTGEEEDVLKKDNIFVGYSPMINCGNTLYNINKGRQFEFTFNNLRTLLIIELAEDYFKEKFLNIDPGVLEKFLLSNIIKDKVIEFYSQEFYAYRIPPLISKKDYQHRGFRIIVDLDSLSSGSIFSQINLRKIKSNKNIADYQLDNFCFSLDKDMLINQLNSIKIARINKLTKKLEKIESNSRILRKTDIKKELYNALYIDSLSDNFIEKIKHDLNL